MPSILKLSFMLLAEPCVGASLGRIRQRPLPWDGSDSRATPGSAVESIPRIGGHAELNEEGYQAVAAVKNDREMDSFVRRVIALRGYRVQDQGKLNGIVPFYSGSRDTQSFEKLEAEVFDSNVASKAEGDELPTLSPGVHVQIMGLFDTGTNLLSALIEKNFPRSVHVYDMPKPAGRYWRMAETPGCVDERNGARYLCSFWKHANLDVLKARSGVRLQEQAGHHVVGLAMIREPLSWLQSIRKEGYDFAKNGNRVNTPDWLVRNVTASPIFYGNSGDVTWPNLEEIWNNQTRSYQNLKAYGFETSLVIRYEDLVVNTSAVMKRVADILGVPMLQGFSQVEESAKGGDSTGHNAAVDKIRNKTYMQKYAQSEVVQACRTIDVSLAARHGYRDCSSDILEWQSLKRKRVHFGAQKQEQLKHGHANLRRAQ